MTRLFSKGSSVPMIVSGAVSVNQESILMTCGYFNNGEQFFYSIKRSSGGGAFIVDNDKGVCCVVGMPVSDGERATVRISTFTATMTNASTKPPTPLLLNTSTTTTTLTNSLFVKVTSPITISSNSTQNLIEHNLTIDSLFPFSFLILNNTVPVLVSEIKQTNNNVTDFLEQQLFFLAVIGLRYFQPRVSLSGATVFVATLLF